MTTQADHFAALNERLDALIAAQAATAEKVEAIDDKVEDVRGEVTKTKDIVEAWETVQRGARFLKWLGGVLAAVAAIVAATKLGLAHLFAR